MSFIQAGERLSLQHHAHKNESLYVQSGKVSIILEEKKGVFVEHILHPQQSIHIPCGCKHRIAAQEDSELWKYLHHTSMMSYDTKMIMEESKLLTRHYDFDMITVNHIKGVL